MKISLNNKPAFTIVELLVAAMIITIIAAIGPGFDLAMRVLNRRVEERFAAINLASAQIESLRYTARQTDGFNDSILEGADDLNEASDAHGATIIVPTGFGVSYTVTDRRWDNADTGATEYKEIAVTSTYGTDNLAITLTTYIADITY
jgi:prepilin-type N-terminal cleavage/methylation domain-containing protein